MANILFGAIVVDARGKIGGQVFRKTATGHALQRKANQSKNVRAGRTQQFQELVSSLRQYSSLTAQERQDLADFSALHPLPNKFGVLRPLPARAMYQKLNANLMTAGLGSLDLKSLSSNLPGATFSAVKLSISAMELQFSNTSDVLPYIVRVYYALTQGNANSVDNSKKRLLSVKTITTAGAFSIPIPADLLPKLAGGTGTPFIGFQLMNTSGWVGAVQWFVPEITP